MKRTSPLFTKWAFTLIGVFFFFSAIAQDYQRPKLVVGIVVDQMRWDYLYRYYDRYEDGGFKRLLGEGFSCDNTYINYLPSYTAVGHSTIFTGSVPAIHGITGNNWTDQITGEKWYCADDPTVSSVGTTGKAGQMSPRNLLVSTMTDQLRLATNFRSKVIGVSLKDRAAIMPAGHAANGAFWFDDGSGKFITSSYYVPTLPQWVADFNRKDVPSQLVANDWNTLYPISTYVQSTPDDVAWEGKFKGEKAPVFPHKISQLYKENKGDIRSTPFGNILTTEFAKAAVAGNDLGADNITDFLTINFASTDYVGHKYGPNSIEVEDTYLRLDKNLKDLFDYLDQKVGAGAYTVFITADHGGANSILFMQKHKIPAGFLSTSTLAKGLKGKLAEKYGTDNLLASSQNYHIGFNRHLIDSLHLDYTQVKQTAVSWLQKQDGIQFAVDIDHIGSASIPEPLKTMIINGYNTKRSGPVIIIPNAEWFGSSGTGTTHGSWNNYDTHIPLIFMGFGIPKGHSYKTWHMTDIAPTISALLHIEVPNGSIGKVITDVVK